MIEFEFHEVVAKVEERFRKVYDSEKIAKAVTESQMAPDQVSTGWWVVLSRFGIAIRFGDKRPDIDVGDALVLNARKIPKKPDAPAIAIVPPAPPPVDAETARRIWLDSLPTEQADKMRAAIASVPEYVP